VVNTKTTAYFAEVDTQDANDAFHLARVTHTFSNLYAEQS
jgi:hypothetical protein